MKKAKRFSALIAAVIMLLSLCACGQSRFNASEDATRAPAAGYSGGYNGVAVASEEYGGFAAADYMSAKAAESPAEVAAFDYPLDPDVEEAALVPGAAAPEQSENTEKIIYSANATVETTEFDETLAALQKMIEKFGGWVESSSTNASNYRNIQRGTPSNRSASYTIRVPGEHFEEMMGSLSNLGNVPFSNIYTENVTSQYYDTQARLKTYEAQEQRLIELLDMAKKVSEVIEIENELTEVRYKIESMETSLRGWDRRVSYSTVYLTIDEVSEYTPEKTVSYGKRMIESLKTGIKDLGEFLIDFVGALPILIVIGLIIWLAVVMIKKAVSAGRKRRQKKQEKSEKTE